MESQLSYIKKPELFEELKSSKGPFYAIIDENVRKHLPEWLVQSPQIFWLKKPEAQKNLQTFGQAVEFFLEAGISRTSVLYAIGGGATTDLCGFVAASILRGIQWVSIPTTLLAMVDGAIGGKVAVNMPQGKNLVGAFHAPSVVFICHDFLSTLPESEWVSGKGEILKYAFLSKKIHELILNKADMEIISIECARYKKEIVEKDFKEESERIFLNFGHTLGHAFESTLQIPHGLAVAMGIGYLLKLNHEDHLLVEWKKLCDLLTLPVGELSLKHYSQFSVEKFKNYLSRDKKKQDSNLRIVRIREIGEPFIEKLSTEDFLKKVEGLHEL